MQNMETKRENLSRIRGNGSFFVELEYAKIVHRIGEAEDFLRPVINSLTYTINGDRSSVVNAVTCHGNFTSQYVMPITREAEQEDQDEDDRVLAEGGDHSSNELIDEAIAGA